MPDTDFDLDLDQEDSPAPSPEETPAAQEPKPITPSGEAEKLAELKVAVDPGKITRSQRVAGPPGSIFENFDNTYTQRKLSAFPRLLFTALMAKALKTATAGEGQSITDILGNQSTGGLAGMLQGDGGNQADVFVNALLSIATQAPDVIKECYMLSLGVSRADWGIVSEIWNLPAEEDGTGGLNDEDEELMLSTFIDQNAEAIMDFYRKTLPALWRRSQSVLNPTQDS